MQATRRIVRGVRALACGGSPRHWSLLLQTPGSKKCLGDWHSVFRYTRPRCNWIPLWNPLWGLLGTPRIYAFTHLCCSSGAHHCRVRISAQGGRNAPALEVVVLLCCCCEPWFARFDDGWRPRGGIFRALRQPWLLPSVDANSSVANRHILTFSRPGASPCYRLSFYGLGSPRSF